MSPDYDSDLARVRTICMGYPEAAEKLSHGSPAFHIEKGKVFAYVWHNHHGDGHTAVMVNTSGREEQAMLVEIDPDFYHIPPYLGPSGWVGMELRGPDTDWERIEDRIAISWEMVAPAPPAGGRWTVSDVEAPPETTESPAERAEKAAIRRRWITLAELVGVVALVISALGLWLNWSDRRQDQAERATESAAHSLVTFSANRTSGGAVLALTDPDHRIQQIDIAFPPSLGAETQAGLGTLAIEAKWFDRELLKATDGGPDKRSGRLPVLITATWWNGGRKMVDRAIYQVNWRTAGRLFRGRTVDLTGASLYERGGAPARLETLWKAEKPAS